MRRKTILSLLLLASTGLFAGETIKKGLNLGILPAISFNSDEGFQYGAIVNLFNYGDGTRYPKYDHSYYLEVSHYTKGSNVFRFYFDSDKLLKGIRTFADISYITEDMLDFYGFNGYQSDYSATRENGNRAFYKMSQKQLRFLADFRGKLPVKNLYWEASYNLVNYNNQAVNYTKLNENTDFPALTPGESLYEKYINWGLLDPKEVNGGLVNAFKAGLQYDTRNVMNNPDKGFCSEALIEVAPSVLNESPYARYSLMHQQYQSIVKNRLNLAVRVGIQGKIGNNNIPFYRIPVLMSPFAFRTTVTGLGGSNSVRGLLRNRVVGDAFALGNFELRWKALNFRFINQNFYLGVNGFYDAAYILDPFGTDIASNITISTSDKADYFNLDTKDGLHSGIGGGLKIVMNENFIVSVELAKALNKSDGEGLYTYIRLNYLF